MREGDNQISALDVSREVPDPSGVFIGNGAIRTFARDLPGLPRHTSDRPCCPDPKKRDSNLTAAIGALFPERGAVGFGFCECWWRDGAKLLRTAA